VCKAKLGAGELQAVGDKVCETRGATKPASTAELRVASQCEPVTEMRGSAPTAECLAAWRTASEASEAAATEEGAPSGNPILLASFAAPLALAAFVLSA
jgi:hypothetical protein